MLAHIRATMFAGAVTTSAALSRAAQMLAKHQDIQDALREEIINAGATALTDPIVGTDGSRINSLHVPAGTHILINIRGANCDTSVWGPDAHLWKPSRWLSGLPTTVADAHGPGVYAHLYAQFRGVPLYLRMMICLG